MIVGIGNVKISSAVQLHSQRIVHRRHQNSHTEGIALNPFLDAIICRIQDEERSVRIQTNR